MRLSREQFIAISLGGIFFVALLYYLLVVSPAVAREKKLREQIKIKESEMVEMLQLKAKWDSLKRYQAEAESVLNKRGERFTLLSFLEGISREVGISDRIQYMKPISFPDQTGPLREEGMEVTLEDIDISQLVNYLYKIEYSANLLNVRRIKMQRKRMADGSAALRVTLQVNTYVRGA